MFSLLLECGNQFEQYLKKLVEKGEYIECRDISAKFTTDVIGTCAFGIEVNALTAEDSEFRKMGKAIVRTNVKTVIKDRLREYPFLFNIFGRFLLDSEVDDFFIRITKESIDYRIKHNFHRHDFIDTLVNMRKDPGDISDKRKSLSLSLRKTYIYV